MPQGWPQATLDRLLLARARYLAGTLSEDTPEIRRQLFMRWLVETGRVSDSLDTVQNILKE